MGLKKVFHMTVFSESSHIQEEGSSMKMKCYNLPMITTVKWNEWVFVNFSMEQIAL